MLTVGAVQVAVAIVAATCPSLRHTVLMRCSPVQLGLTMLAPACDHWLRSMSVTDPRARCRPEERP